MSTLATVILKGADASKPSAAIAGRVYYATDTKKTFRDNGSTWDDVSNAASGGTGISAFPLTIVQDKGVQSGSANTASFAITFPQAVAGSGNTMFAILSCDGSSVVSVPAGWTKDLDVPQATYARLIVAHKTTAGETSATFTSVSGSSWAGYFFEVTGAHTLDVSSTAGTTNSATLNMPSITPSSNAAVFAMVAFVTNAGALTNEARTFDVGWNTISMVAFNATGGRALVGHVLRTPATGVVKPPFINLPYTAFFTSGGCATATFSII